MRKTALIYPSSQWNKAQTIIRVQKQGMTCSSDARLGGCAKHVFGFFKTAACPFVWRESGGLFVIGNFDRNHEVLWQSSKQTS